MSAARFTRGERVKVTTAYGDGLQKARAGTVRKVGRSGAQIRFDDGETLWLPAAKLEAEGGAPQLSLTGDAEAPSCPPTAADVPDARTSRVPSEGRETAASAAEGTLPSVEQSAARPTVDVDLDELERVLARRDESTRALRARESEIAETLSWLASERERLTVELTRIHGVLARLGSLPSGPAPRVGLRREQTERVGRDIETVRAIVAGHPEGLTRAEIAKHTGFSRGRISSLIQRGLSERRLAKLGERNGRYVPGGEK